MEKKEGDSLIGEVFFAIYFQIVNFLIFGLWKSCQTDINKECKFFLAIPVLFLQI